MIQDIKVETVRRKVLDKKPERSSAYGSQEEKQEKAKTGYFVSAYIWNDKTSYGSHLFSTKGMKKVAGEFVLFCLGYNLERVKNLLGFQKMMELMKQA